MWGIITAILGFVVSAAIGLAEAIWAALLAAWAVIGPIVIPIWNALRAVWSDVLQPFWRVVQHVFSKLRDWWDRFLTPVKNALTTIYQIERDFYEALFRPLLDTITRLKQFLELTGLAQTAVGRAIEDFLGQLYRDINGAYQAIVQPVNEVIRTIEDFILVGCNLLRSDLLLGSIFRDIGSIWSIWWASGIRTITPEGRHALQIAGLQHHLRELHADFTAIVTGAGGRYAPHVDAAKDTFRKAIRLEEPENLPPVQPEL